MKKLILASAIVTAFSGAVAHAEEAAEHDVSFNIGATSDYRFRGISQSQLDPAVFAGADYAHTPSGFYAGVWASTIKWIKDSGGDANAEIDLYGGKTGELGVFSYDVGLIRYFYPSNALPVSANTTEAYAQLGYADFSLKYSYALTNFVAWADKSDGSNYIDLSYNPELSDGYVLNLHVGRQVVKGVADADYTDWKLGVTKDFGMFEGSLAVVGTNADKVVYNFGNRGYLGKTGAVLTLTKNF